MSKSTTLPKKFYILADVVLFIICSFIPYFFYYNGINILPPWKFPFFLDYLLIFAIQIIVITIAFSSLRLYSTTRSWDYLYELSRVLLGLLIACAFSGTAVFLIRFDYFSRLVFGYEFLLLFFALGGWRIVKRRILRRMISRGYKNINVLIVGWNNQTDKYINKIRLSPQLGINLVGYIGDANDTRTALVPCQGLFSDFDEVCNTRFVESIVIMPKDGTNTDPVLIGKAMDMGLGIGVVPESLEDMPPLMGMEQFDEIPVMYYQFKGFTPLDSAAKRFFDIVLSVLALIALSPVFILIFLLIRLSSRGPAVFVQKRVGIKGLEFNFYKFRSMVVNAEALKATLEDSNEVRDGVIFKMKNDPRITPVGRFLRKYSLDELPQLFNVLKGDMSIVGPRPPLMSEVIKYRHEQMVRLSVRPGLTGLPQIRGRSNLAFSEWVKWDLWYIRNWSLLLDLRIIISTIPAVFKGDGAY